MADSDGKLTLADIEAAVSPYALNQSGGIGYENAAYRTPPSSASLLETPMADHVDLQRRSGLWLCFYRSRRGLVWGTGDDIAVGEYWPLGECWLEAMQ